MLISTGAIGTVVIPGDLKDLPIRITVTARTPLPQLAACIERVALAKRTVTQ